MNGHVFQAYQSAEKALKALLYAYGVSAWGHSVHELLDSARRVEEDSEDFIRNGP
ncbi:MAG: HEPN domain-containing protein [Candidatus Nezhaarchaeales archaeon]